MIATIYSVCLLCFGFGLTLLSKRFAVDTLKIINMLVAFFSKFYKNSPY